jgi:molybdopterin-guanine dinucleotide biosynthesis protein A
MIHATAYVLAGGQSRRFGEDDKALYEVDGVPLIQRPIDCLSGLFPSVSIIAKDPAAYRSLGVPVVEDAHPQQMPHVGVLTGLEAAETTWSFFLACDMPLMTPAVIEVLWGAREGAEAERPQAVVPVTDHGPQPLAAFYSTDGLNALRQAIQEEWSMKGWLSELRVRTVRFEDKTPFRNVNRKSDLAGAPDKT